MTYGTTKPEGLYIIDRQTYPDGLVLEIHEATLKHTEWFVVANPRSGGVSVKTVGPFYSRRDVYEARDRYSGPR
jgi:hypothetical protein